MKYKIEKLDHFGQGITSVKDKITFVPFTLPGEEIELKITKSKKKYNEAKCINIINVSKDRTKPFCPYFTTCGGCDIEHMSYDDTLTFKKEKAKNILNKAQVDFKEVIMHPTINNKHYRNKITLKVFNNKIGYYKKESHNIVEIEKCFIAKEIINKIINELKKIFLSDGEIVIRTNYKDEILIAAKGKYNFSRKDFSDDLNIVGIIINDKVIYGQDYLITKINNNLFKYSYDSFFQVNDEVASYIFDYIKQNAKEKTVLDLYCGVGTLSIMASYNAQKVYGIEIVPNAIKNAKINEKLNTRDNLQFMLGDVANTVNKIKDNFDLIIVDPPRKGLDKITLEYIMNSDAQKIIYVSCDPITLGRDLQSLNNKYLIKEVNVFDMFPYTYHVESVILLQIKD